MTRRIGLLLASGAVWLALLGLWWLIAALEKGPATLWPTPAQVASALWGLRAAFVQNAGTTLGEAALGFAVGVVLAVAIALAGERYRPLAGSLHGLAIGVYSLPLIALAPVLVLWTGFRADHQGDHRGARVVLPGADQPDAGAAHHRRERAGADARGRRLIVAGLFAR